MSDLTGKGEAMDAIITEALVSDDALTLDKIEFATRVPSRRSIRRAFKEAEELNWVEKKSPDGHTWYPGPKARAMRIDGRFDDVDADIPRMFYVSGAKAPDPFLTGEDVLVSAGVAWRNMGAGFSVGIPDARCLYVDSGGYQAAAYFGDAYPYTPRVLHRWAEHINAQLVFGMDWACEDADILAEAANVDEDDIATVEQRIERSFADQLEQFEHYQTGRYGHEFAPVVQGHDVVDYVEFCHRLDDSPMPTDGVVGVGTVCKRSDRDEILDVVEAVNEILPEAKLHLFGATLDLWKDERFAGLFYSSDTASWLSHGPGDGTWPESKEAREKAYETFRAKVNNYRETVS